MVAINAGVVSFFRHFPAVNLDPLMYQPHTIRASEGGYTLRLLCSTISSWSFNKLSLVGSDRASDGKTMTSVWIWGFNFRYKWVRIYL